MCVRAGSSAGGIAAGSCVPILWVEEAIVMTLARLRLSVADARDLAEGALRGIGYCNDEARIIADHVIDAAMCGYEYSGLPKILNVFESEHFRLPRRLGRSFLDRRLRRVKERKHADIVAAVKSKRNLGLSQHLHCLSGSSAATAMSTPIRRTRSGCCARAASGQAAAALPISVMNERRSR